MVTAVAYAGPGQALHSMISPPTSNRFAGFQFATAVADVGPGQADPDEIDDASWLAK